MKLKQQNYEKIAKLYLIIIDKKAGLKIKASLLLRSCSPEVYSQFLTDLCKLVGNGPLNKQQTDHLQILKSNEAPISIS